jgi:hypothetical protein
MIIKTKEQLEEIFFSIKPHFPEINPSLEKIPKRFHPGWSMGAEVYTSGNILWKNSILGNFSKQFLCGMLAHEFGHLINQRYMLKFTKEQIAQDQRRYDRDNQYRTKIEKEASTTAVLRGFGADIYHLIFQSSLDDDWCEELGRYHLTLEEIKKLTSF